MNGARHLADLLQSQSAVGRRLVFHLVVQDGEWRFQGVGKIARFAPRAHHQVAMMVEQRVQFLRQRRDLRRRVAGQALRFPGADRRQRRTDALQRPQSDAHLQDHACHQADAEHPQRDREDAGELPGSRRYRRQIGGDRERDGCRHGFELQAALDQPQALAIRPRHFAQHHLAQVVHDQCGRQPRVPQRPRADRRLIRQVDLPVLARKLTIVFRHIWRAHQCGCAVGGDLEPSGQILHPVDQIGVDAAFQMQLEQRCQHDIGGQQRSAAQQRRAHDQAESQGFAIRQHPTCCQNQAAPGVPDARMR